MKQVKLTFLFLLINFGGLALGSWLMNNGPMTDWYINLNKAPWTPPGWVFGAAWTIIMICFSIYLGRLFTVDFSKKNTALFVLQVILNVSWNFVFFNLHETTFGLLIITLLTLLLFMFFLKLNYKVNNYKYLLLPYLIWLCIATSLNIYITIYN